MDLVKQTREEIVAAMLLSGIPVPEIAAKLNLHVNSIYQLTKKDEFKEILKAHSAEAFNKAQSIWQGAMEERIPLALKVLDKLLKENNPKAIEFILKTLAIDKGNQTTSSGNIQVFLPTLNPTKETEVKNEAIEITVPTTK